MYLAAPQKLKYKKQCTFLKFTASIHRVDLLHDLYKGVSVNLGHAKPMAVVPGAGNIAELETRCGFGTGHWHAVRRGNSLLWLEMFYILKGLGAGRTMNHCSHLFRSTFKSY